MNRRQFMTLLGGVAAGAVLPVPARASPTPLSVIGAAWRGPNPSDPYFAGALVADWAARTLSIRYAVPLPTRPHGLLAEAGGGLLVTGVRPGAWLLRCDGTGRLQQLHRVENEGDARLGGHIVADASGERLYTTETDQRSGRGRIGVRDLVTLRKIAEWDSHGLDPHQLLLDSDGALMIANGGVPRTPQDKKHDLHRMDASLVRLDANSGECVGQWRLSDPRLSLRHLAWSTDSTGTRRLGIALQAEHSESAQRNAAPVLAVFDGMRLSAPEQRDAGAGYAGDIAAAGDGGFMLSSPQVGLAQLWVPQQPDTLALAVELEETCALSAADTLAPGGVLVSTALGLGRWHPSAAPQLLRWPQPMALDNHWVALS